MKIFVNTDGGSRGNPGLSGIGVSVSAVNGEEIHAISQFLGVKTNNEAEYQAVVASLLWLKTNSIEPTEIFWRLDSKLVVEQLSHRWKIKEPRLQELAKECWKLLTEINVTHSFNYVPRAQNARADELANQAMDMAE